MSYGVEQAEQDRKIGAPRQQAIDELSPCSNDLCGHEHEPLNEGPELHAQDAFAIGLVLLSPARRNGEHQRKPGRST